MRFTTVLFLGRSTPGILADAKEFLGDQLGELVIVTLEGDTLPLPEGLEATVVSSAEFVGILPRLRGGITTLIANGGSTQQLLPVFDRLRGSDTCRVLNLQREGAVQLGPDGQWGPAVVGLRRVQFEDWTSGEVSQIVPVCGGRVRVTADLGEHHEGNPCTIAVPAEPGEYYDEDLRLTITVSLPD